MHHIRSNYLIQIKTICSETNTEPIKNIDKYSDYGLLMFFNQLLIKNNCEPLCREYLEIDLI